MLKEMIQKQLHKKRVEAYEEMLRQQKECNVRGLPSDVIPVEKETDLLQKQVQIISFHRFLTLATDPGKLLQQIRGRFLILAGEGGFLPGEVPGTVRLFFEEHTQEQWLYADEDCYTKDEQLGWPYYRPDWSYDTFLSEPFPGNILALRTDVLKTLAEKEKEKVCRCIWELEALLLEIREPAHLQQVLYHKKVEKVDVDREHGWMVTEPAAAVEDSHQEPLPGAAQKGEERTPEGDCRRQAEEAYFERHGIKAVLEQDKDGFFYPLYEVPEKPLISILIPSKDHADILERCISSIRHLSTYKNCEIIVVDNGSIPEQEVMYQKAAKKYGADYIRKPMNFNFSVMCNLAAKRAKGELLLFLNDDTEVITPDWLERMAGQALQPGVGAVGAKLYYPDQGDGIKRLQHIGITNMYEGPLHKLMAWDDAYIYDRGRNRGVKDLVGVTAACLMITRKAYDAVGGFPEVLAVAYNDVDFCFSLVERGYRNVARLDVTLLHHESLSRGDDHADASKEKRLKEERSLLYSRHPGFYDHDPFYHPLLTSISERYEAARPQENKNLPALHATLQKRVKLEEAMINETLILKLDHLEACHVDSKGRDDIFLIDIHAHVRGLDSADYDFSMFMKHEDGRVFSLPAVRRYRPDVEKTYYEQVHVEMCGFAVKLTTEDMPAGTYTLWMEAKSAISRQRLINRVKDTVRVR